MTVKASTASPLTLGKEIQVITESPTASGSKTRTFSIDAESVLVSLYVASTSGDVDVSVFTVGNDGQEVEIITFPTVSSPTADMLLRKAASALQRIKIVVTYTDACSFEVRARGVQAGASSVVIEGSANFQVSQADVTTAAGVLIASTLQDRRGLLVRNNSTGAQILYLAESLAKATTAVGYPIPNGGNITIDLQAGSTIYAVADSGTIDVRIVQVGGS